MLQSYQFSIIYWNDLRLIEAFSSYANYSLWDEIIISKKEQVALQGLSTNKDLIIQKLDKGKSAVLLNRNGYIKRTNEMFPDSRKFKKLNIQNLEKRLVLCYNKRAGSLVFGKI